MIQKTQRVNQDDNQRATPKTATWLANHRHKRRKNTRPNHRNRPNKPTKRKPISHPTQSRLQNNQTSPDNSAKKQANNPRWNPLFNRLFSFPADGRKLFRLRADDMQNGTGKEKNNSSGADLSFHLF